MASNTEPRSISGFSKLPRELRDLIYSEVYTATDIPSKRLNVSRYRCRALEYTVKPHPDAGGLSQSDGSTKLFHISTWFTSIPLCAVNKIVAIEFVHRILSAEVVFVRSGPLVMQKLLTRLRSDFPVVVGMMKALDLDWTSMPKSGHDRNGDLARTRRTVTQVELPNFFVFISVHTNIRSLTVPFYYYPKDIQAHSKKIRSYPSWKSSTTATESGSISFIKDFWAEFIVNAVAKLCEDDAFGAPRHPLRELHIRHAPFDLWTVLDTSIDNLDDVAEEISAQNSIIDALYIGGRDLEMVADCLLYDKFYWKRGLELKKLRIKAEVQDCVDLEGGKELLITVWRPEVADATVSTQL
jgi:hypothetical protein